VARPPATAAPATAATAPTTSAPRPTLTIAGPRCGVEDGDGQFTGTYTAATTSAERVSWDSPAGVPDGATATITLADDGQLYQYVSATAYGPGGQASATISVTLIGPTEQRHC
jgi:hypothetical protein